MEVRGSNGAFYKVGAAAHSSHSPLPSSHRTEAGGRAEASRYGGGGPDVRARGVGAAEKRGGGRSGRRRRGRGRMSRPYTFT